MILDKDKIYWVYGDDKRSEGWRNKFGCESFEIAVKVANGWIDMGMPCVQIRKADFHPDQERAASHRLIWAAPSPAVDWREESSTWKNKND